MKAVILLVEDDFINRRQIKKTLQEKGYEILEAQDTAEALQQIKSHSIDIAILDINLGEGEADGISLGETLFKKYQIPFIYLTAYDTEQITKRAFTTMPFSYLTKPYKNTDLISAIEIALQQANFLAKHQAKIWVKAHDFQIQLPLQDICYIESVGNYVQVYTHQNKYKCRATIKEMLEKLALPNFIQVHRAYIVNTQKIEKYKTQGLIINNVEIPVSKTFKSALNLAE